VWCVAEKHARRGISRLLWMTAAVAVCYVFGTVWFYLFRGQAAGMSLGAVLSVTVVPFLLPDAGKLLLASLVSERVRKAVRI